MGSIFNECDMCEDCNATMTTFEIAETLKVKHEDVMYVARLLSKDGVIRALPSLDVCLDRPKGHRLRYIFKLTMDEVFILASRLSRQFATAANDKSTTPPAVERVKEFFSKMETTSTNTTPGIYIITDGKYHAIGISDNADALVKTLQIGNAVELSVVLYSKATNSRALETFLHATFAKQRKQGEWFELSPADIQLARETISKLAVV